MKKIIFSAIGILVFTLFGGSFVFAQGMMGNIEIGSDDHTAREEAEGKIVWEKLQARQVTCADLSEEDFGVLGEYFMGQSIGDISRHIAMNRMMESMMGEKGEEQMHVVMGKRLSGCNTSASVSGIGNGWIPMMNMMMGWSSPSGYNKLNSSMMNFGFSPFGGFGWLSMIFWWLLIIVGIVLLVKWLARESRSSRHHEKIALEILKERYAKGEIDKKEFEEKKKDLTL